MNYLYSVYKITNLVNKKVYIGWTSRKNPQLRFKEHIRNHNKKVKYKSKLYRAMRKHGIENFTFDIIYQTSDKNESFSTEKKLIEKFNSIKFGYNIAEGGCGGYVTKGFSIEEKRIMKLKMSMAQRGNKGSGYGKTGEKHHQAKSYRIVKNTGETIIFTGLSKFCRDNNYSAGMISQMANGKRDSCKDIIYASII